MDKEENYLIVYDKDNYYEVDLNNFRVTKTIEHNSSIQEPKFPVNSEICVNKTLQIPNISPRQVQLTDSNQNLSLNEFPFALLNEVFSQDCYEPAIRKFAKFYYQKLKDNDFVDKEYGPINPLFFCLYHEDYTLLREILTEFGYPKKVGNYISAFGFALEQKLDSEVKVFFDYFMDSGTTFFFSRQDFQYILKSRYSYLHKLMAKVIVPSQIQNSPEIIPMPRNARVCFFREKVDLLKKFDIKKNKYVLENLPNPWKSDKVLESEVEFKNSKVLCQLYGKNGQQFQRKDYSKKSTNEKKVDCVCIPFRYSFRIGSPDSVNFLKTFSTSREEELILSDWKKIVLDKWRRRKKFLFIFASIFWIFTILISFTVILFPHFRPLEIICYVFIGFFLLYEIIQLVSYISLDSTR
jgi:hypothetical protein